MPVNIENILAAKEKWMSKDILGPTFSEQVARSLFWQIDETLTESVSTELPFDITKGYIDDQPAVLFAALGSNNSNDDINKIATYTYHLNIEWLIVLKSSGITIYNSHWLKFGTWFALPEFKWSNIDNINKILFALTPESLITNHIANLAREISTPEDVLMPVDDALVNSLDKWRDQALRYAQDYKSIDEQLQLLFAQLFVLRAIEDRNILPEMPSLKTVLDGSPNARLNNILSIAQQKVQSELYHFVSTDFLPEFIIEGIIKDLYFPSQLPYKNSRYNFSWIEADVLGRAYEKYLSTLLLPISLNAPQLKIWEQPERDVKRISVQKVNGVFYTPSYLVRFIVNKCLSSFEFTEDGIPKIPRIADFSCGSGAFLTASVDVLLKKLKKTGIVANWSQQIIEQRAVIGIDIDKRAVTLARLSLWLRFAEEPNPLPLPGLDTIIFAGDSLADDVWNNAPQSYDIVVGNPPFVSTTANSNREYLTKKFETAQGRFDYSYLFVELAISKLKDNGILGLVVPNRIYTNRDAGPLRQLLSNKTNLEAIVDFGSNEVFTGASVYVGTIFARKTQVKTNARIIKVMSLPPRFVNTALARADSDNLTQKFTISFETNQFSGGDPWQLIAPAARAARVSLSEVSVLLSEIAGVYQGIKTGANDIFIVENEENSESEIIKVNNGLGDVFLVEREFTRPVIFGSEIQRYDLVKSTKLLIYPYDKNSVLDIDTLKTTAPNLHAYLKANQEFLASRGSIQNSGFKWYELVRRRDDIWLSSPKLLIRDLALRPSFALDGPGNTFLVGGTAVVPADETFTYALLGYLNSSIASWFLRSITPSFNSNFQKFEPQHLNRLPIPNALLQDDGLVNSVSYHAEQILLNKSVNNFDVALMHENDLDELIAAAIGLDLNITL